MNSSKEHNNWITVGEVINLVRKPLALYTDHVVKKLHSNLRHRLKGGCANPIVCEKANIVKNLCHSCHQWYNELVKLHRTRDKRQINWRKNCDTSKWPADPWEVAKFFMPVLGHNKGNMKDPESTDLSSLLNVLEWMDDVIFFPNKRVDLDLVRKLRSEVRNPWAHAANQELTTDDLDNAFDIANKMLKELDVVFNCNEVTKCIEDIKFVQSKGITNVIKAELNALILLRDEVVADVSRQITKDYEKKLEHLEKRITQLEMLNIQEVERPARIKYCIPDKPCKFIGRRAEVKKIISSLVENACGIVSIVGGPGVGKSTIAIEVSHNLRDNHDIIVIFSYLSNVSTVSDVFLRLCQDAGVNPGKDSKLSFTLWLRNIKEKVVLVMDNIEQLLEEEVRSEFTKLVLTLRKNSQQQLQILATTRTVFSIPNQPTKNFEIGELDVKASVEILRNYCANIQVEDSYLCALANLCGFIPLALCITGSIIPCLDDPVELIQWLKEKPMKVLQSDTTQCVRKVIEFSFQMLSNEDQKAFARLSVFNGNFLKKSAQDVIERDGLETQAFLKQLVDRSLIQRSSDKRFVIHLLIRRFLADHDQFQGERAIGEELMVKHFLQLCHDCTLKCYSKDGYTDARKLLKKDAHNIEEMLKICCRNEERNLNANIIETLTSSNIYNFSSTFFFRFAWDILPRTILRDFHEKCITLAETRKQVTIEITFRCLVAIQEGHESAWNSREYIDMMEFIKKLFDRNETELKEEGYLHQFCYYFYARYYSSKERNKPYPDLPENNLQFLSEDKNQSSIDKVYEALILIERGHLNKIRASKLSNSDKINQEYLDCAKSFYNQALSLAKELLGDHELTSACHKYLGDLYIRDKEGLMYYFNAIKLRRELQLDCNEPFVYLLKNYGFCLFYNGRFEKSVETLHEARKLAEKIGEKRPCTANVYFALARALLSWKPDSQEAGKYAKAVMEMKDLLDSDNAKEIHIFGAPEENIAK